MAKEKSKNEVYAEIISEIAFRAIAFIDGVELLGKNPKEKKLLKDNDIHAYLSSDNKVKIDVYLNLYYGFNIPDTVCRVQESVKTAIEKETCYKVSEINVSVVSIVCEEEYQPEIVHNFNETEDDADSVAENITDKENK